MKYPIGTTYVMEVRKTGPQAPSWEEVIPERLNGEDISKLAPEERARRCIEFWNSTLRPHDSLRELVNVYRVECAKTALPPF